MPWRHFSISSLPLPPPWKGATCSGDRLGKTLVLPAQILESPCPAQLKEEIGRGWMQWRHSRLIQWLVLFAVVHPGQHCPPQTFLLRGHQNRVSIGCSERDYSQSPTDGPTLYRQGLGELCQAGHCPPSLGRPHGPWAGTLGSFTSKIES